MRWGRANQPAGRRYQPDQKHDFDAEPVCGAIGCSPASRGKPSRSGRPSAAAASRISSAVRAASRTRYRFRLANALEFSEADREAFLAASRPSQSTWSSVLRSRFSLQRSWVDKLSSRRSGRSSEMRGCSHSRAPAGLERRGSRWSWRTSSSRSTPIVPCSSSWHLPSTSTSFRMWWPRRWE
jgi:hypothetical protein